MRGLWRRLWGAGRVGRSSKIECVYVLVAEAVYDHGVIGVYSSPERARAAAEAIRPRTDGHHNFRIEPTEIDKTYEGVFTYRVSDTMDRDLRTPDISLVSKQQPGRYGGGA